MEVVAKSRNSLIITAPVLVPDERDCEFIYGQRVDKPQGIGGMVNEYP